MGALARESDPSTAHSAAASVNTGRIEEIVVGHIRSHGPSTTHEIAEITGLELVTVSPRMKPLTRKALVRDSGIRREGKSKRKSIVWELHPGV